MEISDKGLKLIKDFEGFSARMYVCPAGYLTIGWGHRVLPNEVEKYKKAVLTFEDAETLLRNDLEPCYRAIREMVFVPLAQGQFDALCSFIFNLGATRFFSSTMRKMLNRGNYAGAALEFPKWVYANRVKMAGLVRRREAEQKRFREVY